MTVQLKNGKKTPCSMPIRSELDHERSDRMPAMKIASVVAQLKSERDRLDKAIAALSELGGSGRASGRKGVLSAAARERIAKAQRERWKKFKATKKR